MEETVIGQSQINSATWNDTRTTINITASAENATAITMNAGYSPNSSDILSLTTPGVNGTLELSDLNHGSNQMLYISVIPLDAENNEHLELATYAVYPIPNPIIGIVKTCDETKYIVDMVEKKRGATGCSEKWKNGKRVVIKEKCAGGGEVRGGQFIDHMIATSYTPSGSNSKFGTWQFAYNATPAFLSATNIKVSSIIGYPSCGPTSPSAMKQIPTFNLTNATASYGTYISSQLWRGGVIEATVGGVKKNIARIIVNGHNEAANNVEAYIEYWDDFSSSYVNCERIIPPAS